MALEKDIQRILAPAIDFKAPYARQMLKALVDLIDPRIGVTISVASVEVTFSSDGDLSFVTLTPSSRSVHPTRVNLYIGSDEITRKVGATIKEAIADSNAAPFLPAAGEKAR